MYISINKCTYFFSMFDENDNLYYLEALLKLFSRPKIIQKNQE